MAVTQERGNETIQDRIDQPTRS